MSSRNGKDHSASARLQSHNTSTARRSGTSTTRSSIEASALGNLANASSLEQDSRRHSSPTRAGSSMLHSRGGTTIRDEARSTELPNSFASTATNYTESPFTTYASDRTGQAQPHALSEGESTTVQNNRAGRKSADNAAAKMAEADISEPGAPCDSTSKNDMELDMRRMIEKIWDYNAKDPNLFSNIWEQVKKGQTPNRGSDASIKGVNSQAATVVHENDQLPSLDPTNAQIQSVSRPSLGPLQQDGPEMRKYPVQRRARKSPNAGNNSIHRDQTLDSGTTAPILPSVVHPTSTGPANTATRIESPNPALQGQSLRAAIESLSESLRPNKQINRQGEVSPEVVYVKGAGPELSGPAETSSPTEETSDSTVWPQEKKWALATAAASALTSSPMNAGKNISPMEIVHILDRNPCYAELCDFLEVRGFVINRKHFARSLLGSVPSLDTNGSNMRRFSRVSISSLCDLPNNRAANGTVNATVNGAVNGSVNGATNGRVNGVVNGAAKKTSSQNDGVVECYENGIPQSTRGEPSWKEGKKHQNPTTSRVGSSGQLGELARSDQAEPTVDAASRSRPRQVNWGAPETHMTESERKRFASRSRLNQNQETAASTPLTKEEMARKRSFAEVVDLTEDLSDEEDEIRRLKAQLSLFHKSNNKPAKPSIVSASGAVSDRAKATLIHPTSTEEKRKDRKRLLGSTDRSGLNSSVATEDESLDLSPFKYADSQQHLLLSGIIIRPIDKKKDVLRRTTYNPKTIAKDILVAAGRHPTIAPLNNHLDILRRKFAYISNTSDLSTFRWDLVDPSRQESTGTGQDIDMNQDFDMNGDVNMNQDVDMDNTDDEDLRMENGTPAVRNGMQVSSAAGGEARAATPCVVDTQPIKETPRRRHWNVSRGGEMNVRGSMFNHNGLQPSSRPQGLMHSDSRTREVAQSSSRLEEEDSSDESPEAIEPGSRPQEASPSEPQAATQPSSQPQEASPDEPQRRSGRPKTSPQPGISGSNQAKPPSRPRPSDAVPSRPSGLRNVMPSDGVAVVIEYRSSGIGNGKRKSVSNEPWPRKKEKASIHPSTPSYKVYRCLWKNCPYELHNLENLRNHVRKHRENLDDGPFPCLWAGCRRSTVLKDQEDENMGEKDVLKPLEFESDAAWERHVNKKHVDQYAWEFGDGPSAHPSDAEASDFLSDSQGRRLTPRISANSTAPPDPLPLSSSRKTARIYHKAHGNRTEAEKAQAVLNSVVAKKRATGLGITNGGSPFMTESLRSSMRAGEPGIRKMREEDL